MTGEIQSIVLQRSLTLKEERSDSVDIFSIFCHNNMNHKKAVLQKHTVSLRKKE